MEIRPPTSPLQERETNHLTYSQMFQEYHHANCCLQYLQMMQINQITLYDKHLPVYLTLLPHPREFWIKIWQQDISSRNHHSDSLKQHVQLHWEDAWAGSTIKESRIGAFLLLNSKEESSRLIKKRKAGGIF